MTRPVNIAIILLALVVTAVAVVYSKHQTRKLFVELQALGDERDDMDIEWGRLEIQQGMLTTHGQIERDARGKLGMVSLAAGNMVIVKP